jgi:hypothetical protein
MAIYLRRGDEKFDCSHPETPSIGADSCKLNPGVRSKRDVIIPDDRSLCRDPSTPPLQLVHRLYGQNIIVSHMGRGFIELGRMKSTLLQGPLKAPYSSLAGLFEVGLRHKIHSSVAKTVQVRDNRLHSCKVVVIDHT